MSSDAAGIVILVDDNPERSGKTTQRLQVAKWNVLTLDNVYEAIEEAHERLPAAVICRADLHDQQAETLLALFNTHPDFQQVPVIIVGKLEPDAKGNRAASYSVSAVINDSQAESELIDTLRTVTAPDYVNPDIIPYIGETQEKREEKEPGEWSTVAIPQELASGFYMPVQPPPETAAPDYPPTQSPETLAAVPPPMEDIPSPGEPAAGQDFPPPPKVPAPPPPPLPSARPPVRPPRPAMLEKIISEADGTLQIPIDSISPQAAPSPAPPAMTPPAAAKKFPPLSPPPPHIPETDELTIEPGEKDPFPVDEMVLNQKLRGIRHDQVKNALEAAGWEFFGEDTGLAPGSPSYLYQRNDSLLRIYVNRLGVITMLGFN